MRILAGDSVQLEPDELRVESTVLPTTETGTVNPEASSLRTGGLERAALGLVYLVSVASLAGFATFSLHPELLVRAQVSAATYGRMMVLAPRAQIALAFAALALFLVRRIGARWLTSFAIVYLLSLGAELAGTTVGLPFGPYSYTDGLGWKWLGHVPALIPLSWYMMALPSYAIAAWRYPGRVNVAQRVALGSFILLSWDLALDPAMSLATKYWIWATDGSYYGMPILNLVGWFLTGAALMVVFAALQADSWIERLSGSWLIGFYGANLVLPVGMCIAAGMWGAVAATAAALVAAGVVARAGTRAMVHP
jgi:putative membrane protein